MTRQDNLKKFEEAIKKSWNKDTCHPDIKVWSRKNPSKGQCGITALLIQEYLGGRIAMNKRLHHVWNILPNKKEYDLTKNQFPIKTKLERDGFISRENMFNNKLAIKAKVKQRYKIFKKRFKDNIK